MDELVQLVEMDHELRAIHATEDEELARVERELGLVKRVHQNLRATARVINAGRIRRLAFQRSLLQKFIADR